MSAVLEPVDATPSRSSTSLLPGKSTYLPSERLTVEVATGDDRPECVRITHLGEVVADVRVDDAHVLLPALPEGGYGLMLLDEAETVLARSALEVLANPRSRMRYGFVADFRPGRDPSLVGDDVRRLHLTAVQFYDWAYRHADLLGGGETYADALGQQVSLETVRRLVLEVQSAGAVALGYAAVYGVGTDLWSQWSQAALLEPTGQPHSLGDFLQLVDPADPAWLAHLTADLLASMERVGFDGFHLDQYGYPKSAVRPDGRVVDLAAAFPEMLAAIRAALPDARLVFNNVNDFPTWTTARAPQDATYIEVWEPHHDLGSLAWVITRARNVNPARPVVLAAYQTVYDREPTPVADATARLTMATVFSHGATQLLVGEGDRLLVDPYYVRSHRREPATDDMLVRWYDFLVSHGDLLMDPGAQDVTGSFAGAYNHDVVIEAPGRAANQAVRFTVAPEPGAVWTRVVQTQHGLVVHLINLTEQSETGWDTPKTPVTQLPDLRIRVRRCGADAPIVAVADPDAIAELTTLPGEHDGDDMVADLPPLHTWQLLHIRRPVTTGGRGV